MGLAEADGGEDEGGKTRGVRVTPGGTVVAVCHGRHDGAAAGAFPVPGALTADPEAGEAAYAVVTPATIAMSAQATPAACTARVRRV